MKTLNEIANEVYDAYRRFYENDDNIQAQIDHLKGEIDELGDAIENHKNCSWSDCDKHDERLIDYAPIKNTIQDELSDILIMTLALCRWAKMTDSRFDIEWHINKKMEYNKSRNDHKEQR